MRVFKCSLNLVAACLLVLLGTAGSQSICAIEGMVRSIQGASLFAVVEALVFPEAIGGEASLLL